MNNPCIGLASVGLLLAICALGARGSCPSGELSCNDGQCVKSASWCDEKKDCQDKSDEAFCRKLSWFSPSDPNKCNGSRYICKDGRCVPSHAECNGYPDCKDGTDEDNCEKRYEDDQSNHDDQSKKDEESKEDDRRDDDDDNGWDNGWDDYDNRDVDDNEKEGFTTPTETPPTTESHTQTSESSTSEYYDHPQTIATTTPSTSLLSFYDKKNMIESTRKTFEPTIRTDSAGSYRGRPNPPDAGRTQSYLDSTPWTTRPYPTRRVVHTQRTSYNYPPTPPHHRTPAPYEASDPYRPNQTHRPSYLHPPGSPHQDRHYGSPDQYRPTQTHRPSYLHPPGSPHQDPVAPYTGRRKSLPRFSFAKNYTGSRALRNGDPAKSGAQWVLGLRDPSGGWGGNTSRALVALALVNNGFLIVGSPDNALMKKYLKVYLAVKLMNSESMGPNELAGHVNALLATCQDPRDFHGTDVVRLLRDKLLPARHERFAPRADPFVLLTLCLADEELSSGQLHSLMRTLMGQPRNDRGKDSLSLSISAFSCHLHRYVTLSHADSTYVQNLRNMLRNATSTLLQLRLGDGSFGSVYSTALAGQALMSLNDSLDWDPNPLFRFLLEHQDNVGSFGDFLATYLSLPAVSGRSLLHLRNIRCHQHLLQEDLTPREILSYRGPKQHIRYSLLFDHPLSNAYSVQVFVPHGIHFFDVMRVADYQNKHFNFLYQEEKGRIGVFSISDVPNDVERGISWQLYIRSNSALGIPSRNEAYHGDIRELLARADQHYVFWYRPVEL